MYCTVADIINDVTEARLIELTDDSATPTAVVVPLVEAKIIESDNIINSYIQQIAILPITNSADLSVLKTISITLSVCDLWQRRLQAEMSENIINRRNYAMAMLKDITKGVIKLNTPTIATAIGKPFLKVSRRTSRWEKNYFNDN